MRAVFSIVSLLAVLAIVGFVVKKQLGSQVTAVPPAAGMPAVSPGATPQAQSQQVQHQVKEALQGTMQQARPMPTDDK
jgi:hypothetical protein